MTVRSRRSMAVLAAALLASGACNKWVVHPVPTPPAPMRTLRGTTRVTLTDQRTLELIRVIIASDSLFGISAYEDRGRHAMLLRDVTRIEQQVRNPKQTLIGLAVLGGFLFLFTDAFGGPFIGK
jgi:hypothetical protein